MKGVTFDPCFQVEIYRGFNPHAREGRDYGRSEAVKHIARFNPHAREGRDYILLLVRLGKYRFNPHAREGRDVRDAYRQPDLRGFNPHAREGRDALSRCPLLTARMVSIHTPVKGVTDPTPPSPTISHSFNPHAREGRDNAKETKQ